MNKKTLGKNGEKLAENFLIKKGFKILQKNFCIRGGEIDIIAQEKETIIFIEVKTRKSKIFGEVIEQISKRQKNKIIKTAMNYLNLNNLSNCHWRIDVITIFYQTKNYQINHFKNAIAFF